MGRNVLDEHKWEVNEKHQSKENASNGDDLRMVVIPFKGLGVADPCFFSQTCHPQNVFAQIPGSNAIETEYAK